MTTARLITIPISHYCEKARWALEWAGLPYVEERHMQIFHYFAVLPVSRGISVPVLDTGDEVVADSTDILHWVNDRAAPDRKLFPSGPTRSEVEQLENRFDLELGPAARRVAYHWYLPHRELVRRFNCAGVPEWQIKLGFPIYPLATGYLRLRLGVRASRVPEDVRALDELFAEISRRLADRRRYLVGDTFTAADLTFASLAAIVLLPPEYGIPLPTLEEAHDEMRTQVAKWRSTPAGEFVLRMFRDHRRPRDAKSSAARS